MRRKISTMDIRHNLGDILNRVALRHEQYVIERKGRPLAALVSLEAQRAVRQKRRDR